ncbi:MAG: hypothetical protein Q9168_002015 [Polycauliona sp. 1 TL-2023]
MGLSAGGIPNYTDEPRTYLPASQCANGVTLPHIAMASSYMRCRSETPDLDISYATDRETDRSPILVQNIDRPLESWKKHVHRCKKFDAFPAPASKKPGFISAKGGHFLPDDIYAFDPSFFRISAEEARAMDPQTRILLECAFEAAESAGFPLSDLLGSNTGAFAAGVDPDYVFSIAKDMIGSSKYTALGVAHSLLANRLSHFFGLTGPSMTVDAACASSSYALHLACHSILAGECSTAFVGGSKLLMGPFLWSGLDTMG